jgi:hypothetical protein
MSNIKLKPCPFCGSDKLKTDGTSGPTHYYEKDGMKNWKIIVCSVRCNKCHARGTTVSTAVDTTKNYYEELQQLRERASKAWNVRVGEEA